MRRRRLRLRFWFAVAWCLLLVPAGLWLTAYLALRPEAIEARVRSELARVLQYPVTFRKLAFSWRLGAQFRELEVACGPIPAVGSERESSPSAFLHAAALEVVPDYWGLIRGRLEFSRVVLNSPEIRILRSPDGRWNFQDVLRRNVVAVSTGNLGGGGGVRTLVVRGGTVDLKDDCTFGESFSCALRDLQGTLAYSGDDVVEFDLRFRTPCGSVEIAGTSSVRRGEPVVCATLNVRRVDLALLKHLLPPSLADELKAWRLEGFARLCADLELADGRLTLTSAEGELFPATISSPLMPYPLKGIQGTVRLGSSSLELLDVKGSAGGAELSASGRLRLSRPWFRGASPLEGATCEHLEIELKSFDLQRRLRAFLSPRLQKIYDDFKPAGRFGLMLKTSSPCAFPPPVEDVSLLVRIEDGAFCYTKFPYRLSHLRGEILVEKGRWSFKRALQTLGGPVLATVGGRGAELRPGGEVDVTIKVRSVPLDERFRSALPPDTKAIWDAFQVAGRGEGDIYVSRAADPSVTTTASDLFAPQESRPRPRKATVRITARPQGIRMCYKEFPYEIDGIVGRMDLELKSRRMTFRDLKGRHGGETITADGVLNYGQPYLFKLLLDCGSLAVDEALVSALPERGRVMVENLDFRGRVHATVKLHSTQPGKTVVTSNLGIIEARIRHKEFPYELSLSEGRVEIFGEDSVQWTGLATRPGARPYVVLSGGVSAAEGRRSLRFNVDVGDVSFDDNLRRALPPELRRFVENMNLAGTYQGRIETVCDVDKDDPGSYQLRYTGKNIRVKDGSLDFGLKVREMEAEGSFTGTRGSGQDATLLGEVRVESAWFNRIHLGKAKVKIALGKPLDCIAEAAGGKTSPEMPYMPSRPLLESLRSKQSKDTLQMLLHSDDLYGGKLDGLVYVDTGPAQEIGGEFLVEGLQVSRSVKDVFASGEAKAAGTVRGKVSFRGRRGDTRSLEGSGESVVENARLGEVPLFFGVLSLLYGEASSRHFFDQITLQFKIADGLFKASKGHGIEIRSPAVKLAGGGTMDFSGNLDLIFQTHIVDFKIPVVEQILMLLKKGLAQVSIRGTLSEPDVQFVTGAGMMRFDIGSGEGARPPSAPKKPPPEKPPPEKPLPE